MLNEDLLWDYADGFLPQEEKSRVDAYLKAHPEWQAKLDAIMAEKRAFSEQPLAHPDAGFAAGVLRAWAAEQAPVKQKDKGQDWILWSIALLFCAMIALPFLFNSGTPSADQPLFQLPEQYQPKFSLPEFDWNGLFNSGLLRNAFLLLLGYLSVKILEKYWRVRHLRTA